MMKILILLISWAYVQSQTLETLLKGFQKPYLFTQEANEYSKEKSQSLFYYTQISKCLPKDISDWKCGYFCNQHPGMQDLQLYFNKSHDGSAFCGYNSIENQIVLAFRSSQQLKNFVEDVKMNKVHYPLCDNCFVHNGFYQTYLDLKDSVLKCTEDLKAKYPNGQITIVGHSLGAALATLLTLDLSIKGYEVENLFTYGSPRIGNKEFAQYSVQKMSVKHKYRVTHNKDLVVHIPPESFGYSHITQEVWYNKDSSSFAMCDGIDSEDLKCASSVWATSIMDHFNYHGNHYQCGDSLYKLLSLM